MGGRERCRTRPRPSPDGFGRQQRGRKHGARGGVARQETTCARRSGAGVAVARDERLLRLEILCPLRRGALSYGAVDEMDVRPIYDRRPGARRNSPVACQCFAGRTVRPAADTDCSGRKRHFARRGRSDGPPVGRGGRRDDDRALQRRHPRLGNAQRLRAVGSHPRPDPLCIVCADRPVPDDSPLPRSVAAGANRVHDGAGVSERPCRCCSARRHRPPAKWPGWRRYARSLPRCASADRRRFHDRCRKP